MRLISRVPTSVDVCAILGPEPLLCKRHASSALVDPHEALKGKHVLLLFASFTEGDSFLADVVHKLKQVYFTVPESEFEVLFVSDDCDATHFEVLYSSMPWAAIPFRDKARRDAVKKLLKVVEVPKGIMLAPDGFVLNRRAVASILLEKQGRESDWPWERKPDPSCFA